MEQLSLGNDFLPELDASKTKKAVIDAFEKYLICKYLTHEEREAATTPAYVERAYGPTNVTSDQTANVAIYNTDAQKARREYCERVERAVAKLPRMEKFLIERRYMAEDSRYITDQRVYAIEFQPPISQPVYAKYRWAAFYKLALSLRIAVLKDEEKTGD